MKSSTFFLNSSKIHKKNYLMGATKTNQYSINTINIAKRADALGHPARVTIVKSLKSNNYYRNIDFQQILHLSQTTVHSHLMKLKAANLIKFHFNMREYHITLIKDDLEDLDFFLKE